MVYFQLDLLPLVNCIVEIFDSNSNSNSEKKKFRNSTSNSNSKEMIFRNSISNSNSMKRKTGVPSKTPENSNFFSIG